jgi:thioester reductase-like protein
MASQPPKLFSHDQIFLPADISYPQVLKNKKEPHKKNIMLTGVLGYVGIHLLVELLTIDGAIIYCPIRNKDGKSYNERFVETLNKFSINLSATELSRVHLFQSDLSHALLGLSSDSYDLIAERIDAIYHAASSVNFIQPYNLISNDNIQGLLEILRFAGHKQTKPLILLSSISVYSWGKIFTHREYAKEDDDINDNIHAITSDIGYVQSKWVMEKLTEQAAQRGLPLIVLRLGYAMYHSKTGACSDTQAWGSIVTTCLSTRSVPLLEDFRAGLTSVDFIAKSIVKISTTGDAMGKKYNIVPASSNKITLTYFFKQLEYLFDYKFNYVPYKNWVNLWCKDLTSPLYPLHDLFTSNVCGGRSLIELYQHAYLLDNTNFTLHFPDNEKIAPTLSKDELSNYLNFLNR